MDTKVRKSTGDSEDVADRNQPDHQGSRSSKIGTLYMNLIYFLTYCLTALVVEAGPRSSSRHSATKSAAFNSLFRRAYNLKIEIAASNVIAGTIATAMIMSADKYGIPYLYLPWLVNTIKGLLLNEGPTVYRLSRIILPNATFPGVSFIVAIVILCVEELCIWYKVLRNFQACWNNYYGQTTGESAKTNTNYTQGQTIANN